MPTISVPGQAGISYVVPADLRNHCVGAIQHPPQPIAAWAPQLAEFVAACEATNGVGSCKAPLQVLRTHYVKARLDDVPEAKRDNFKAYVAQCVPWVSDDNRFLDSTGAAGAWR